MQDDRKAVWSIPYVSVAFFASLKQNFIAYRYHKMYSNNIVNFQESPRILNACTKKVWKLIEGTTYIYMDLKNGIESDNIEKNWINCKVINSDEFIWKESWILYFSVLMNFYQD